MRSSQRSPERSLSVPGSPRHLFAAALAGLLGLLLLLAACFGDRPAPTAPGNVEMNPVFQFSSLASGDVRTVFGPVTVTRQTGTPVTQSFALQGFGPMATLRIVNGGSDGKNRVSSGSVSLDGMEVVSQSEFGSKVAGIEKSITLRNSSTLAVRLTGTPGDRITISIDGTLATEAPVSPAGGTVQLLGQQVQLTLPPGAVPVPIQITAEPAPSPDSAAAPGTTIDMGPDGTTFDQPVTLSIAFDPGQLYPGSHPRSLRMFWWNVDHWERLPNQQFDAARGIVSAQTTHFSEFSLLPDTVDFCPGNPAMEQSLRVAVNHVAPDGTILVCNGSFPVANELIDKPLTLKSANPAGATLTDSVVGGGNGGAPVVRIQGYSTGLVRITDLTVTVADAGITAAGPFDKVQIDHVTLSGTPALYGAVAVRVETGTGILSGARVEVTHTAFSMLGLGVWPVTGVEFNTRYSTFDLFTGGAIDYSSNGTATGQSYGEIDHNTLTNCATSGCMRLLTGGALWVHHNTMTALSQPVTLGAITLSTGTANPTPGAVTIEDNVITSATTGADVNTPAGWQFQNGIYIQDANVRTHLIRRNTVTNAYAALQVLNGDIDFRDNQVSGGYLAFRQSGPNRTVSITRNDFTGLLNSLTATNTGGSYQCNWWGSVNGPTSPPASPPGSTYSPWAMGPIAGTSNACNASPGFPVVRVCSTGNGTDVTFPTGAQGISFVSPGGTVKFCPETFVLNNVAVNKPMTLTSEGPGMATIDAGANLRALNIASVVGTGPVVLTGLRFTGGTSQTINVGLSAGTVQVNNNEFQPAQTNAFGVSPFGSRSGINIGVTSGTPASVTIDHNTFTGGDVGVNGGGLLGVSLAVAHNTFSGQMSATVSVGATGLATSILIDQNTMSDCGINNCIFVGQPATISANQLSSRLARKPFIMLQAGTNSATPTVISGNTITGLDAVTGARGNSASYASNNAITINSGVATVTGNTISNSFIGINTNLTGSSGLVATDNVMSTIGFPYSASTTVAGTAVVSATRNDITDYFGGVSATAGFNLGSLNLRCNWWGTTAGPVNMSGAIPGTSYAPWAMAPIAGTANACDPTPPDLSVVRVCSTGSGSFITVPTAAQGVSLVSTGGTVRFCNETFPANNITIGRPMTVTSEGPGMATIDAGTNTNAFVISSSAGGGPIEVASLRFINGSTQHISVNASVGPVSITGNQFEPGQTNPLGVTPFGQRRGITVAGTTNATISGNTFLNGDQAISLGLITGSLAISGNTFTGQVNTSISMFNGGTPTLTIDHNSFSSCAPSACLFLALPALVEANTFTAQVSRRSTAFIQVGVTAVVGAPATITGNTFTGLDLGPGSRGVGSTYPVNNAIIITSGASLPVNITGNTITRTFFGVGHGGNNAAVVTDNVITTTAFPIGGQTGTPGVVPLTANWNDFSDYVNAVGNTPGLNLSALNIRCNWWGVSTGPVAMPAEIPASTFTPWALAAVAGGPHTGCTP